MTSRHPHGDGAPADAPSAPNEAPACTGLALDARQRAMLAEMGVRVWWPAAPAPERAPASDAPAASPPVQARDLSAPMPDQGDAKNVAQSDGMALASGEKLQHFAARPAAEPPTAPITDLAAPAALAAAGPATMPREAIARMDWPALREAVRQCQACGLHAQRRQAVFGMGDERAHWLVVGEGPGEQEDAQGLPFVGPSGQLLDAMLRAIGLDRQARSGDVAARDPALPPLSQPAQPVFIANAVKCRPPGNRNPHPDELAHCLPYLQRQIALLQPRIILALGRFAVQSLLGSTEPLGRLRGRVHRYQGIPVIVSYHPAYLLRQPAEKARAWQDLCLALEVAEREGAST